MMSEKHRQVQVAIDQGCMEALKRIDTITYIYMVYKQWYYLGTPLVSDHQFDHYEDILKKHDPENPALQIVGLLYPTCKCCSKSS